MYTVLYNANILHDPRRADQGYIIRDPRFEFTVNGIDSAEFTVDVTNRSYSYLAKLAGTVYLYRDDTDLLFAGRIINSARDWDNSQRITCEGLAGALHDSVWAPYNFPEDYENDAAYQTAAASGNVVAYLLGKMLDSHNSQVESDRQITLGTVTVIDSNNYISRASVDYADTWTAITEALSGSTLGGYLVTRYTAGGVYLDYLATLPTAASPEIEFDRNLLDFADDVSATELYTVILPVGADGLTIEGLSDGSISGGYVKSGKTISYTAGVTAYGRITRVVTWDDVTVATNLRSKAVAMLGSVGRKLKEALTITAADLTFTSGSSAGFRVGTSIHAVSEPHGLDGTFPLLNLVLDIFDPAKTEVTLNAEALTSAELAAARRAAVDARATRQDYQIGKARGELTVLRETVTAQQTAIAQTPEEIRLSAQTVTETLRGEIGAVDGRVKSVKNDVATLTLTSEAIEGRITTIETDGVTQVKTSNGMTFDSEGLHIDREGADTETLIDETGMVVKDTDTDEDILRADINGVNAVNLTARQYLIIGKHARFQDITGDGTACYWVEDGGTI